MFRKNLLKRIGYSWFLVVFVALLANACSGNRSDEGTDVVTYIKAFSSESSTIIGNTISLKATDNLNNDVTSQAQFYIDGVLNEDGSSFTPSHSGSIQIVAKMDSFESKPITVQVEALTGVNFVHRILYEDFTGTWCGNCPIATVRYENLVAQNNKAVFLGIHGPQGSGDPYFNPTAHSIITQKNVWGFPTILINGKYSWPTSNNNYTDMSFPLQYLQPYSKIGIAVNTQLSGNTLHGEVKVSFAETYQNLKMTIFFVETDLHYAQHNYFNGTGGKPVFYDGQPIIPNYVHHNVVRDNLTAVAGEAIPVAQTQENEVYTKGVSYTIPTGIVTGNTKLIIVITDSNGVVLNTREAVCDTENPVEII